MIGPFDIPGAYVGDCVELMSKMPEASIHSVVTSPPYWGLRDYGVEGQLGLEDTLDEYLDKMVAVFREVHRVLRDDGTLWLNLGDSYIGSRGGAQGLNGACAGRSTSSERYVNEKRGAGLKPKDLAGVPWRVALALQADGWWLRSDIVWSKPTCIPESVQDRPTRSHEFIFLMAKSERYYYDAEAIREPSTSERPSGNGFDRPQQRTKNPGSENRWPLQPTRNKRDVWTVKSIPYREAHFAVFPPKLIEPCILAGTAPRVCAACGAPWERVVEVSYDNPGNRTTNGPRSLKRRHETPGFARRLERRSKTTGWRRSCDCNAAWTAAVVFDPFFGSGTTGRVAEDNGRDWLGFDINPRYVELQERRMAQKGLRF